jgi:glutamate formiminotransferase
MKFILFLTFFNYAHAMNISEVNEITITDEIQSNIRLDSGSKLYLNQLAFKNVQTNTTQTTNNIISITTK